MWQEVNVTSEVRKNMIRRWQLNLLSRCVAENIKSDCRLLSCASQFSNSPHGNFSTSEDRIRADMNFEFWMHFTTSVWIYVIFLQPLYCHNVFCSCFFPLASVRAKDLKSPSVIICRSRASLGDIQVPSWVSWQSQVVIVSVGSWVTAFLLDGCLCQSV